MFISKERLVPVGAEFLSAQNIAKLALPIVGQGAYLPPRIMVFAIPRRGRRVPTARNNVTNPILRKTTLRTRNINKPAGLGRILRRKTRTKIYFSFPALF